LKGKFRDLSFFVTIQVVMPAQAGIQTHSAIGWIPAFAGMTEKAE